jgi:hypothetical protein
MGGYGRSADRCEVCSGHQHPASAERTSCPGRDQGRATETDQRHLLCHLIQSHAAYGEERDPVGPVHLVISPRISPEHARIKLTATHEHGVLVEVIPDT